MPKSTNAGGFAPIQPKPHFQSLRRMWLHVTRSRARAALGLAVLCLTLYALIPKFGLRPQLEDPLRQFTIILASVSAAALFLPELSSDLWTLTGKQVQSLIPRVRRESLAKAIISADAFDEDWADLVFGQALEPLIQAGENPSLIVKNLNYKIGVRLNQTVKFSSWAGVAHIVETVQNSERVLPAVSDDGSLWVTIARTDRALLSEYRESACLAREVVPLKSLEGTELEAGNWRAAIVDACRVSVVLNGGDQLVEVDSADDVYPDLVRWKFRPELSAATERMPVQIKVDYPMDPGQARFPVIFGGFYCAGATVLDVRVYGLGETDQLIVDPFVARGIGERQQVIKPAEPGLYCQEAGFSTGRDSILWPGSGVLFSWPKKCGDHVAT